LLDASTAAHQMRQGKLRAEDLLRACLERIEEREVQVQAWAHLEPEAALRRARALDRSGVAGLLHGLPVGVKDLLDTCDMPTAYGSTVYAGHRPVADAAAVALAREAGAIVLGKTVTTEFATYHPGKTHNPHRAGHTPGGSSSGSAAAVADGMVPLAFGTQTAASIIRPAAFCGVVGFKPGFGSIARAGIKSLAGSLDTVGGFGRSVADVALFAAALTGRHDWMALDTDQRFRIGICHTPSWPLAMADARAALAQVAMQLERAGAAVTDVQLPPAFDRLADVQAAVMQFEAARSLAWERTQRDAELSPALRALLAAGWAIDGEQHQRNLAEAQHARTAIDGRFSEVDVLLAPSAPGEAPVGLEATGDPVFSRMWTLLGLPCIHLPSGTGSTGLPVGVQLVGRQGQERQLLQAAHWAHLQLKASGAGG
jgi:Asp-tRNA(Asn)/Glu-tRNA(Gln) amidotransferase A subunit family amidase